MVGSKDGSYNHCMLPGEIPLGVNGVRDIWGKCYRDTGYLRELLHYISNVRFGRLLRIRSAYLGMPADTKVFLRGLRLWKEGRSQQGLLECKLKLELLFLNYL